MAQKTQSLPLQPGTGCGPIRKRLHIDLFQTIWAFGLQMPQLINIDQQPPNPPETTHSSCEVSAWVFPKHPKWDCKSRTLPETNMAPENGWLAY